MSAVIDRRYRREKIHPARNVPAFLVWRAVSLEIARGAEDFPARETSHKE
jgi:hypothetical protein